MHKLESAAFSPFLAVYVAAMEVVWRIIIESYKFFPGTFRALTLLFLARKFKTVPTAGKCSIVVRNIAFMVLSAPLYAHAFGYM